MSTCAELGAGGAACGGAIDASGYCERCGMHYQPVPQAGPEAGTAAAPASQGAAAVAAVPSTGPSTRSSTGSSTGRGTGSRGRSSSGSGSSSGSRGSSFGRGRRGRAVTRLEEADPREALLADPSVPERKRFCRNPRCQHKVGRSAAGRTGRVEGFCPNCGRAYSFRPPLSPGTEVADRYVVDGAIGRGGLGWVYLATDRKVGRYVVLKGLVNPDDATMAQVPLDELRALGQANHPNIVAVHDAVMHPYRLPGSGAAGRAGAADAGTVVPIDYIVMDYIGGRSLLQLHREARAREEYLPLVEICEYLLQALDALQHLHSRGLLYNDFSPDNLMRSPDGRVWLIDLGGVSVADEPGGGAWGKEGYRDPWGNPPSVQTDLYGVGRTMAALSFPMPGFSDARLGLPDPADEPLLARHESYHLFLRRATNPDLEYRFFTTAEMADQLEAVLREVRALERDTPQPGQSDLFGPEMRVVAANPDVFPAQPDPVAAALALPDPQIDPADPQARRLASIGAGGGPSEVLAALAGLGEETPESRLRAARARVELVARGEAEQRTRLSTELGKLAADLPDDPRVGWFAGLAGLVTGDVEAAHAAFDAVLRTLPGEAAPKLALALCDELRGRPAEAADRYQTVWRTDRSYVSAAFGLARTRLELGHRAQAADVLRQLPSESRYCGVAVLCGLVAGRPDGDPDGALAPEFFTTAERLRKQGTADDLDLDDQHRYRGHAEVFTAALRWYRDGRAWPHELLPDRPPPPRLLGFELTEGGLRDGLEASYRQLAQADPERKAHWVDQANARRKWSLW